MVRAIGVIWLAVWHVVGVGDWAGWLVMGWQDMGGVHDTWWTGIARWSEDAARDGGDPAASEVWKSGGGSGRRGRACGGRRWTERTRGGWEGQTGRSLRPSPARRTQSPQTATRSAPYFGLFAIFPGSEFGPPCLIWLISCLIRALSAQNTIFSGGLRLLAASPDALYSKFAHYRSSSGGNHSSSSSARSHNAASARRVRYCIPRERVV